MNRRYALTRNDPQLLAVFGIARYLSAPQVARLGLVGLGDSDGTDLSNVYRRLRRLVQAGLLRRLVARQFGGSVQTGVWTLAPDGRAIAEEAYPLVQPLPAKEVSAAFLTHTLRLNDVLLELLLDLRSSSLQPLADLPFRWLPEEEEALQFRERDDRSGETRTRALKPDAILELGSLGRRLFLEAETGTQSLSTADPSNTGAILTRFPSDRKTAMPLASPLEASRSSAGPDERVAGHSASR